MDWAGFRPLRPGRIHLWCMKCHRKMSNTERGKYDPPRAQLVQSFCERCGQGGKDAPEYFLDGRGRQISWEEIERHVARVVDAEPRS